jgi:subtilisin family serine protease
VHAYFGVLMPGITSTDTLHRHKWPLWAMLCIALYVGSMCAVVRAAEAQDARYIVRFRSGRNSFYGSANAWQSSAVARLGDLGLQSIDQISHDNSVVVRLRFEDALVVSSRTDVADVELDERVWALRETNDPLLGEQGSLAVESGSGVTSAWDITTGSKRAMVAVIDSGADLKHPDLQGSIWRNSEEIAGNRRDDDRNGWVDDTYGYDFVNKDGLPQDDNGHGTHVAGIIAAVGNNATGIAGVAWGSRIVVIKALDEVGSGYVSSIVKAIDYATDLKKRGVPIAVMNLSLGGGSRSRALYRAVERARNHDILLVAAAGNEGANNDVEPLYPASLPLDSILSVAAVNTEGELAGFSNYGAETVHLAAPGSAILSTALRTSGVEYRKLSGTSMASPHVAGILALAASANPRLTSLQVRAVLLNSTSPRSGLQAVTISGGVVDAVSAVQAAVNTQPLPRIFGYVTAFNKAVAQAAVTLTSRNDPFYSQVVTTGKDGSFSISEVPLGQYKLSIRVSGRHVRPVAVRASAARTIRRNFSIRR